MYMPPYEGSCQPRTPTPDASRLPLQLNRGGAGSHSHVDQPIEENGHTEQLKQTQPGRGCINFQSHSPPKCAALLQSAHAEGVYPQASHLQCTHFPTQEFLNREKELNKKINEEERVIGLKKANEYFKSWGLCREQRDILMKSYYDLTNEIDSINLETVKNMVTNW
jgi:hypothetical protein